MVARLRAAVAVALLVGIFGLAALVLGGLVAAAVWAARTGSPAGAGVGALLATVGFVLVAALLRIVRAVPVVPTGLAVPATAQPELWAMVRRAAEVVRTRPPDEIRLVAEANAGVTEDSRYLGLVPGDRVLYVGVPLLQTMTRAELLWVLGHEMAHYSERHTALSGVTRRGLLALREVVAGIGPRHPLGWLFRGYLALYARVAHALWRREELDADRWASALSGSATGIAALRAVAVTGATWSTFVRDHGSVATSIAMVPRGLFSGYADFLSDPVRSRLDVDELVADEPRSPFDTHPSTSQRTERLRALADGGLVTSGGDLDDEPALGVLVDAVRVVDDVEAYVARAGSLTQVPWEQAVLLGNRQRDERRAVAVMSAADALTSSVADLSTVFDLATDRRGRDLAVVLAGRPLDDEAAADLLVDALGVVVRAALVGAGHATHVLRWDRPDVIVDETGTEVDVPSLVAGVPGDRAQAEWLLEVLRGEGISRTWNPAVSSPVVGPAGPEVRAVLVTAQTWGYAHPVLYVTEAGLAVRRLGYREYLSIPPLSPQKSPDQLPAHSVRINGLRLLSDPDTEVVPWSEVEHVTYVDGARPRVTVRRDGRSTTYRAIGVAGNGREAFAGFNYGRMSLG
ncbi:hypothetical protein GCM10023339_06290 [Alloalcanivorax gelatiniphagus]